MILTAGLIFAGPISGASFLPGGRDAVSVDAASTDATAKVKADGGAYLRKDTSTSSGQVTVLNNGSKITIIQEVFNSKKSTKAEDRWYYVSSGNKKGYIRSDLVGDIKFASLAAQTTTAVNYRIGPDTEMTKKGTLDKGKSLTVLLPARLKGSDTIWYRSTIGKNTYYLSSEFVKLTSGGTAAAAASTSKSTAASSSTAQTTTANKPFDPASVKITGLTYPECVQVGKGFGLNGTIKSPVNIDTVTVGIVDLSGNWLTSKKVNVKSKSFDIHKVDSDIKFGKLAEGFYKYRIDITAGGQSFTKVDSQFRVAKNELTAKLLGNPTSGGKARNVYTFSTSNCKKLFSVSGHSKAVVPQGMTFTGSEYYIVYGMSSAQAIVTYSADGKRVTSGGFSFNMGHPNGITWDPVTGICYIFKGNQKTIYTWDPKANKYGKATTPYSSSGVAYDQTTGDIYATSQSGVRVYSADGKFSHKKLFSRCSHGIKHYIQDCGAQDGFVFHGISGSNKQKTNFLDIYRAQDGKYLGSIKITIGEIESAVVGNDGYLQLLINTSGKTDYVWKTPLNVNDLKVTASN